MTRRACSVCRLPGHRAPSCPSRNAGARPKISPFLPKHGLALQTVPVSSHKPFQPISHPPTIQDPEPEEAVPEVILPPPPSIPRVAETMKGRSEMEEEWTPLRPLAKRQERIGYLRSLLEKALHNEAGWQVLAKEALNWED